MIEMLRGCVVRLESDRAIIDVGGVGYSVFVANSARAELHQGKETSLFTHLHVREDAMLLYGFLRWEEKETFEALIKVSGIGPKVAMAILSGLPARELVLAVACGDLARLTSISGVGKKTAQRIVLELKEKMGAAAAEELTEAGAAAAPVDPGWTAGSDAVAALMVLGYSASEATKAVGTAQQAGAEETQTLIREALKRLG